MVVSSRERVRDARVWTTGALVLPPIQCLFTPRLGSGGWPDEENRPTTAATAQRCLPNSLARLCPTDRLLESEIP